MRRLMIPREHGAWAMLMLPYLAGIATAGWSAGAPLRVALGAGGILALFMAQAPLMKLVKSRYRRGGAGRKAGDLWYSAAVYSAVGALFFGSVMLFGGPRELPALGAVALATGLLQAWMAVSLGERSIAAEAIGIILLTLAAPLGVALASGGGSWGRQALMLWAANASYYGVSIFTVKMKVVSPGRRGRRLTAGAKLARARVSFIYIATVIMSWLLAALTGAGPALAPVAFLPATLHAAWGTARLDSPLNIRREGFTQLGLSVIFTMIIVAAWRSNW
ncbi:MAG: YwiC-like family protein [Thermoleophilia bacterium]